jgi:hypothetical protein
VNGAEIPKRISLSVTPRKVLLTLVSCPSGFDVGESAACCPCVDESGACCACAVADGAAAGAAAIPAAGTSALFAGASVAVSRSDGLEACLVCESELLRGLTPSNRGFPKRTNNVTTAATTATSAICPIGASNPSSRRAGGSGPGLGQKGVIRRS